MSTTTDDFDCDALISRLARPLAAADREAFRSAAEDALAHVAVRGEGANYRAIVNLQRIYFDPPTEGRARWGIEQELRPTKLKAAPAIEFSGDGRRVRYRKHGR